IKLPIGHLQKTKNKKQKPTKILTTQNTQTIKTQLDLTRYPYQQPLNQLHQYLHHPLLTNYQQLYIIHRKPTPALQKPLQQHFKKHKTVRQCTRGMPSERRFALTVAEL
ncbi:Smr/MutS family protein, partial [Staphylococcus epidermidis]|uniref:Smr/MutS family protein n=1 Tax=Staphylococcus epidermidis TaxID=1282 RepID=UPI0037D9E70E